MSYILDALKKVEHDKVRKAMSAGMTSISGDLFLDHPHESSRSNTWKIVILVVLASLGTFAVTWFLLKGHKKLELTVAPKSNTPVSAVSPVAPVPAPQVQVQPVTQPGVTKAPPALKRTVKPEKKETTPPAPSQPQKPPLRTASAPSDIKVSGIAWQEERTARRAVINGFLLHEGATVSGAKILEILQDRVKFGSPAGVFEIRMDTAATHHGASK